jgi:hypothetical protein
MLEYCNICKKKKEHWNWKHTKIDLGDTFIEGWICGEHFHDTGSRERVPERIEREREKYAKETLQPYRNGELSKEFVQAYPEKVKKLDPQVVKKAKYTWGDIPVYKRMQKG